MMNKLKRQQCKSKFILKSSCSSKFYKIHSKIGVFKIVSKTEELFSVQIAPLKKRHQHLSKKITILHITVSNKTPTLIQKITIYKSPPLQKYIVKTVLFRTSLSEASSTESSEGFCSIQ